MTKLLNKLTKPYIIDMEYYIYHIPGVKIGMTEDLEKRMSDQGFTEWEILETHTCIYEGSRRELELQAEYGLPIDAIPYFKIVNISTPISTRKGGLGLVNSDKFFNVCSRGGKAGRKLTFEQAEEIRAKYVPRKYTAKMLAEEYGVRFVTIRKIIYKESYITP